MDGIVFFLFFIKFLINQIRWMSEKYSGVRALWNNNTKTFHLRNGNIIQPPKVFSDLLSSTITNVNITQLDGILRIGNEQQQQFEFDLAQKLSSENLQDEKFWIGLQYLVFDIPNSSANFDERFNLLKTISLTQGTHMILFQIILLCKKDSPLRIIEQIICEGTDHLMKTLNDIISKGGEGIILKLPKSSYESGTTSSMLKVIGKLEGKARIKSINLNHATCEL